MEQNELKDFRKRKRAEDLGGGICPFQLPYNLNPSPHPSLHFPTSTNALNKCSLRTADVFPVVDSLPP